MPNLYKFADDQSTDDEESRAGVDSGPGADLQEPAADTEFASLVAETIELFANRGIAARDMAPLFRLQDVLRRRTVEARAPSIERGDCTLANEVLLGRACLVIDLMTFAGETSEKAAQSISRQLSAANVRFPDQGGDVRAWKRLLNFRSALLHGSKLEHAEARDAYGDFKNELNDVPADRRVQYALGHFI